MVEQLILIVIVQMVVIVGLTRFIMRSEDYRSGKHLPTSELPRVTGDYQPDVSVTNTTPPGDD